MVTMKEFAGREVSAAIDLVGLSTDTKPIKYHKDTLLANGSSFFEIDTSSIFFYDAENHVWIKFGGRN